MTRGGGNDSLANLLSSSHTSFPGLHSNTFYRMMSKLVITVAVVATVSFAQMIPINPPNGVWAPPRADSRCGPDFGWAGCGDGLCCSASEWCGSGPMHCGGPMGNWGQGGGNNWQGGWGQGNNWQGDYNAWQGGYNDWQGGYNDGQGGWNGNGQGMGPPNGAWGPPRGDSRCGPDFGWAGCDSGQCCSMSEYCGYGPQFCNNNWL